MEGLQNSFYPDDPEQPERPEKPHLYVVDHKQDDPGRRKRLLVAAAVTLIVVSSVVGGVAGSLIAPYLFGSNPLSVYGAGGFSGSPYSIKIDGKTPVSPVTAVAQKLQPSIVNIRTKQRDVASVHGDSKGVGSGVIIRPEGYIITNLHVIEDAEEIWVSVGSDDHKGSVVGTDQESDLAVVKIDKTGLPAAEAGSTKSIKVGDLVVAIGSPFGFEHTVTSGIISGLRRTINLPDKGESGPRTYTNMIQTDAPINPGNSGGALADWQGKVIGINALIMSNSGVNEGVGFAIPVETAMSVANQLIKKGRASHPYMGIIGQNIEPGAVEGYPIQPGEKGALVVDVVAGSPASKAGLKKGDVILSINGQRVTSMDELMNVVRQLEVGDKLSLDYRRKNDRQRCELALTDKPD